MYFAYKLNKQGDKIQPWPTPLQIWNQSVPCPVLTVASWPAYRFLKRQVRWSGMPISWRIFHSLLWSTQSKALSQWSRSRCFSGILLLFWWSNEMLTIWSLVPLPFRNPTWTSGSSWVHVLLKPGLKNLEQLVTTKITYGQYIVKQIPVHPYSGIPLSNRREQTTDIGNNLDRSPKHEWKKTNSRIMCCMIL